MGVWRKLRTLQQDRLGFVALDVVIMVACRE